MSGSSLVTKKRQNVLALAVATMAAAGVLSSYSMGAVVNWTGAADQMWATAGNWTGVDTPPTNSLFADQAQFDLPDYTGKQPILGAVANINGLIFGDGATVTGSLTLTASTGNNAVFIGNGGILMNANSGPVNLITIAGVGTSRSQSWTNASSNDLTYGLLNRNGAAGTTLNIVYTSTGKITTQSLNTNGLVAASGNNINGPWVTFTDPTGTYFATNTTNTSGAAIGAYTSGVVLTDANSIGAATAATENDELSGATLTNNVVTATAPTANTIRYTGAAQTIQLGTSAASNVTLSVRSLMNAGTGKLTIANGSGNTGGLSFTGTELILFASTADIEVAAPIVNTPTGNHSITVGGSNRVLINSLINNGTGTLTVNDASGPMASSPTGAQQIYIGGSKQLVLNAATGGISFTGRGTSQTTGADNISIVDNPGGASSVRITGASPAGVSLLGNNTYTGGTTLDAGATLILGGFFGTSGSNLGTGTLTINGGTIAAFATNQGFTQGNNNNQIWNGNWTEGPGAISFGTGTILLNQNITITANNTFGIGLGAIGDGGRGFGLTIAGTGTGGFSLNGVDTFTGPVTVLNGLATVSLGNNNATNRNTLIILDPGAGLNASSRDNLQLAGFQDGPDVTATSGAGNISQNTSGRNINLTGTGNYSFSGVIGSSNGQNIGIIKAGTGTQALSGSNAYTETTSIYAGKLNLDFSGFNAPATDILYHNVALFADTFNRYSWAMNGGTLQVTGSATAANSQTVGELTGGIGNVKLVSNATSPHDLLLSVGNMTHQAGGGLNIVLPSGAQTATNGVMTTRLNNNGIIGGWATVTTASGTDWAVSGAQQIPAAASYVFETPGTWDDGGGSGDLVIWGASLPAGTPVSFNTVSGGAIGAATASGLVAGRLYFVASTSTQDGVPFIKVVPVLGQSTPVSNSSGFTGTLSINTQGLISPLTTYTPFVGTGDATTTNLLITGNATLGAAETINTLKISPTGPGQSLDVQNFGLFLSSNTTFMNVNNAVANENVGGLLFTGSNDFEIKSSAATGTAQRIRANAGDFVIQQYGTGVLTISTIIGDTGGSGVSKEGPGKLVLSNVNIFGGPVFLDQGVLNFNSVVSRTGLGGNGSSLGNGTSIVFNGGTLQYASGYSLDNGDITARNVTFNPGGAVIDTNGNNITWANAFGGGDVNGFVGGNVPTGGLTKTGAGSLTILNVGNYGGDTNVNGGSLIVSNTTGSATGTGRVFLNGGILGGAGKIAGAVSAGTGAHTIAPSAGLAGNTATTLTLGGLTTSGQTTLAFNLNTPFNVGTSAASVNDKLVVNGTVNITAGGALAITNNNTGVPSLGYYKAIGYTTLTGPAAHTPNMGITMPAIVNSISYVLDTAHDPGFIDIHRGFLGDANDDGIVNAIDLGILATNFNSTTANWSLGDYNGDGNVNAIDLGILATNFNGVVGGGSFQSALESFPELEAAFFGGASSSVPEPASLALLGIGAAALLGRRRRQV